MLYTIVAVLVIILDQWVKYWVAGNLPVGVGVREFIPGIISLVNVHNDGAAFSFLSGSGARIYFIIICGVFTVGVIIALATNLISGPIGRWSAVLVVAGGLANCIDRILYGYVQDMFKVELFDFAVFNVADIFITVFCFVFILYVLFGGEKKQDYDDDDGQYDEDDEEEDARPVFNRRRNDEDDYEPANRRSAPARASRGDGRGDPRSDSRRSSSARAPRKSKYEEEYEQYKAARAARQQTQPDYPQEAPARRPAQEMDPSDPFAEWERANARVEAQRSAYAAAAAGQSAPRTQAPSQPSYPQPQQRPAPQQAPAYRPAPQPQQAPAYRPAPQTPAYPQTTQQQPSSGSDEFSLDDILNEFK